jgi:hypothetical protein
MTVALSRTLVALGYHSINYTAENGQNDEEIVRSIACCYQLDKSMSLLLQKPQVLPKLSAQPASLLCSKIVNAPMQIFQLSIELAQAQEAALNLVASHGRNENSSLVESINSIDHDMIVLYRKIKQVR